MASSLGSRPRVGSRPMERISLPEVVQNAGTPTGCVRSGRRWATIRGTNAPSSALNGCDASRGWRPASQLLGDDADALSMRNLRGLNRPAPRTPAPLGKSLNTQGEGVRLLQFTLIS